MPAPKIDTLVPEVSDDTPRIAMEAEKLGFDGVWSMENSNDGYLPHVLTAEHTSDLTLGTRIALSFTRSPMVTAQLAWDLARYSDGRFILGLGTQVKGHNERRFSVDWEAPGPRLREVIESVRHIWEVFQGDQESLSYDGEYYSFSLMTENFNPGPIDNPDVPIFIGGFNEYNVRLAGELADGLTIHPLMSPLHIDEVITEQIEAGATRNNRKPEEVTIQVSPFTITGETDQEIEKNRERVRRRIAFYASTRTYHDALKVHDWQDLGAELHELSKSKRWNDMADLVSDEMIETFAVEASPEALADSAIDMYGDIVDRIVLPFEYADSYMVD